MRERQILFSGAMVLAILAWTKTQTRRLRGLAKINEAPGAWELLGVRDGFAQFYSSSRDAHVFLRCPYGEPGDRLWVRETWAPADCMYQDHDLDEPGVVAYRADLSARFQHPGRYAEPGAVPAYDLESWNFGSLRWRPSIHMPRWASRITLEVAGVRVERLQEITEEDARAEGITGSSPPGDFAMSCEGANGYVCAFAELWESINGKRAPWARNPWVWVVEFRRCDDA
jgi:hypothetical protein